MPTVMLCSSKEDNALLKLLGNDEGGSGHKLDIKAKVIDQHRIKNITPVKSISDVQSISKVEEIMPIDDDLALKIKAEVGHIDFSYHILPVSSILKGTVAPVRHRVRHGFSNKARNW
jgi:hypothetical protein